MSNPHTPTKAEACQHALETFAEEHHHAPDTHEKARLISETIKVWEHEEIEATHPVAQAD